MSIASLSGAAAAWLLAFPGKYRPFRLESPFFAANQLQFEPATLMQRTVQALTCT